MTVTDITGRELQVGDRIELVEMGLNKDGTPDPSPIRPGTKGEITWINPLRYGYGDDHHAQIAVKWEIPRSLMLVTPPDRFRIIEKETP